MAYNHREAFCHMQYQGLSYAAKILLNIWNSRDGVTPMATISKEYGVEISHINFAGDRFDPDYKPKKGDLIWRDWTKEECIQEGKRSFAARVQELDKYSKMTELEMQILIDKIQWDPRETIRAIVQRGEQWHIDHAIQEIFDMKQPKLELVKEDWP